MTWLEIIDTSVKIGLGAFIGGLFAYVLNKQVHDQEIKKEILLDNRQTLKDLSKKFEDIHIKLIAFSTQVMHDSTFYILELKSASDNIEINKPNFDERRIEVGEKVIVELYSLQGVLMLYGYKKMSSIIYDYTVLVGKILPYKEMLNNDVEKDGDGIVELDEYTKSLKEIQNLRNAFYEAANYYLNSQNS